MIALQFRKWVSLAAGGGAWLFQKDIAWVSEGLPVFSGSPFLLRGEVRLPHAIPNILGIGSSLTGRTNGRLQRRGMRMGLIYHYTSPEAALSILHDKKLRFTDCEYLNDPAELAYCYRICSAVLADARYGCGIPENRGDCASAVGSNLYMDSCWCAEDAPSLRTYVLCASIARDDVSLWKDYSGGGTGLGYAIGLDVDVLRDELGKISAHPSSPWIVVPECGSVLYDEAQQRQRVERVVEDYENEIRACENAFGGDSVGRVMQSEGARFDLWHAIRRQALFMKSDAFSCEQEYRVSLSAAPSDGNYFDLSIREKGEVCEREEIPIELSYRVGASGVMTPYLEWDFSSCVDQPVREVRIAPSMEVDLVKRGMEKFLCHEGYGGVGVIPSSVQLRF